MNNFLQDHSMEINSQKSVYSSNIQKSLPAIIGSKIIRHTNKTEHFKYLGVGFSLDLNWEKSLKIIVSTAKGRLTTLTNKWIPLQTKAMVINCVILKAVEYTLNFAHLSDGDSKEHNKCIAKCIKYSIPMHKSSFSDPCKPHLSAKKPIRTHHDHQHPDNKSLVPHTRGDGRQEHQKVQFVLIPS